MVRSLALLATLSIASAARAAEAPGTGIGDDPVADARAAYVEGVERVKRAEWADALAAFEQSSRLHPHAGTSFNIGVCERAVGHHLRARDAFQRARAQHAASPTELTRQQQIDTETYLAETEQLLAHLRVHLDPPDAELTVDGRPLEVNEGAAGAVLTAGTLPPGHGQVPPRPDFELVAEPGAHIFLVGRKGYGSAVVQRSFEPGARGTLDLVLARLPGVVRVTAQQPGAIVSIDYLEVGPAPVELSRPAGSYLVAVRKTGFTPYQTKVTVQAGERVDLQAPLPPVPRPVWKKWWVWATALSAATAAIVLTYLLTRPTTYDGGTSGWVAHPVTFP
jgi:hypothetical protein